ncbi:MAG: hypothetical protein ACKOC5_09795 [Chloroflexota bacterium]
MSSTRKIALIVWLLYQGLSIVMFRGVIASIPSILRGEAVINADELVPFFNPHSQLLDQAAGKFNQLTNGFEFRVRYSFHTTWMRYYKVLPFALVLVVPLIAYGSYLAVAWFLSRILPDYKSESIYIITAAPVLVIFLIMDYAKITHFYTLILGFSLYVIAIVLVTYGLIFPQKQPYKPIVAACLVTLINPAVHYLVLFALFMALTVAVLVLLDGWTALRSGAWRILLNPGRWLPALQAARRDWRRVAVENRFLRSVGAFVVLVFATLIPYALFVKFYALRGVPNLSETVPGDYYFIVDASISPGHLLAFDMAGIMDKYTTGDYLSKTPRWANSVYTLLMMLPLLWGRMRRSLFSSDAMRSFAIVAYAGIIFSMWATLGYSEPSWMPTFHRTIAFISNFANGTQTLPGDLVVKLLATIVQVLRFPHRFEFIMFVMACVMAPMSLVWMEGQASAWLRQRFNASPLARGADDPAALPAARRLRPRRRAGTQPAWRRGWARLRSAVKVSPARRRAGLLANLPLIVALLALVPMLSNAAYVRVFLSGNFSNFLAAYPVGPLQEVKQALLRLPPGKVVVLPPTETAKAQLDINDVDHKFIDKFHIYYLDLPSYYYGLTGDSDNKHEFFLLLRALYYQQAWWINIARDLNLRYIVINKELRATTVGGQEYLREIERILVPEFDRRSAYVRKLLENESYVLYEFIDLPRAERVPLYIDTDWSTFVQILTANLDLTRYYDLRHSNVSDDLTGYDQLVVVASSEHDAALDLFIKANPTLFFQPSSTILPFNPDLISSAYYLSPMFRLFQFFSDSKWNRINMITPGLWGTLKGAFIGVPRPTEFRIDVTLPEDGEYRLLMRGAAASNQLIATSRLFTAPQWYQLTSDPKNLAFYDKTQVFAARRVPMDISAYSQSDLDHLIPSDVVIINSRYQYFDLGVVTGKKGKYTIYFDKTDNTPLLVEGITAVPEEFYANLAFPENVTLLSRDQLCCGPLIQQP